MRYIFRYFESSLMHHRPPSPAQLFSSSSYQKSPAFPHSKRRRDVFFLSRRRIANSNMYSFQTRWRSPWHLICEANWYRQLWYLGHWWRTRRGRSAGSELVWASSSLLLSVCFRLILILKSCLRSLEFLQLNLMLNRCRWSLLWPTGSHQIVSRARLST